MSLLPLLFDDFRPIRKNLAVSVLGPLLDEELVNFRNPELNFNKALGELDHPRNSSSITVEKDNFHASIDVQQFKPEEITVKLTEDNMVTVEGKHEERQDEHGYISRHFVRKYLLPEDYDAEKLQSKLSSDGVLNIIAPKKPKEKEIEYREIPITLTGPVKSLGNLSQKVQKKLGKPIKRLNKKR
ncbi:hypothetical protein ABEB36_003819 [Hypothenemus hampei]|uniref:SHSP domain-containing protein n=1 Tax=Hypothenemus hampei TaxID=57062 RepID=A0ABD1F179_HYPHA